MRATIRLENTDGSLHRWITPGESKRMKARGEITRSTSRRSPGVSFRLVEVAKPSESKVSMPVITLSDMLKVAGVQRLNPNDEERDIERLIGFGLLPENVVYPQHGYL
jgi:hypothetical protein